MGKLPGSPHRIRSPGAAGRFHRIKVDEEAGYVINTFTNGGLVVSDIHDYRILWALGKVLYLVFFFRHSLIPMDMSGLL